MAECWRPIPGYEGIYDISEFAEVRCWYTRKGFPSRRVKSDTPVPIHPVAHFKKSKGVWELRVNLTGLDGKRKSFMVKHLMRDVWMQGKKPGMVVECIDRDQTNCSRYNLRYTTFREVAKKIPKQNRVPIKKLDAKTKKVLEFYPSLAEAGRRNYLSPRAVDLRIRNKVVIDGVFFRRDR